ncbi:MAG: helix-turn-helix domain-containing protein [Anaerolineales bacterium]
MAIQEQPDVGARIRELRDSQGLSLRALAEECGLSVNAISRIERGESSPTVSSLHRLALGLNVPITDFFRGNEDQSTILVRRTERRRSKSQGVLLESLGSGLSAQRLEPFLVTLAAGAVASDEPLSHRGEEFIFCVEGEVEYEIGDTIYRLEAGDSLLFMADQLHQLRNAHIETARVLVILQSDGDDIAHTQKQHLMPSGG